MAKQINEEALDVIVDYYGPRANYLQHNCNWGSVSYTGPEADVNVNDPLMQHNDIYDTTIRRAAGFSNVLEDLYHKTNTPKWHHKDELRKELIRSYDTSYWDLATWLWVFIVHRNTGSGASFQQDHGYRNNVVQLFGQHLSIDSMISMVKNQYISTGLPTFTSIGNQPPAPKGKSNWEFMFDDARKIAIDLAHQLSDSPTAWTHKQVVDYMNEYNIRNGHRRFNFQYAAVAMDISDYFPELVDPESHTYLGNNAKRQVKLLFKGYKEDDAMEILQDRMNFHIDFKSLEDYLCDACRFLEDYDPHQRGIYFNNSGFDASPWFKDRSGANRW